MRFSRVALVMASAVMLTPEIQPLAAERVELKLQGSAYLDEEACATGTAAAGCRLNFEVTGETAKIIYDGMTAEGVFQECTGEIEKFDESGMHCIKGKTTADYYCDFAYSFKEGEFGGGGDGC